MDVAQEGDGVQDSLGRQAADSGETSKGTDGIGGKAADSNRLDGNHRSDDMRDAARPYRHVRPSKRREIKEGKRGYAEHISRTATGLNNEKR